MKTELLNIYNLVFGFSTDRPLAYSIKFWTFLFCVACLVSFISWLYPELDLFCWYVWYYFQLTSLLLSLVVVESTSIVIIWRYTADYWLSVYGHYTYVYELCWDEPNDIYQYVKWVIEEQEKLDQKAAEAAIEEAKIQKEYVNTLVSDTTYVAVILFVTSALFLYFYL